MVELDPERAEATSAWRGRVTVWLLGANAALHVAWIVAAYAEYELLGRIMAGAGAFTREEALANDARMGVFAIVSVVSWVVTGIAFVRWMAAAHDTAIASRASVGGIRRVDVIASFFIPLVNLIRPYQVVQAIHDGCDPARLPIASEVTVHQDANYRAPASETRVVPPSRWSRAPVGGWWAAYLLWGFGSWPAAVASSGTGATALRDAAVLKGGGYALSLVAAALAMLVVKRIGERQREYVRREVAAERARADRAAA